jgi:hypothetical protein
VDALGDEPEVEAQYRDKEDGVGHPSNAKKPANTYRNATFSHENPSYTPDGPSGFGRSGR